MLDETAYSSGVSLSGSALLGLHLRAAVLEAQEAETQTATLDRARARDQLRNRLGQLVEQRRHDLSEALDAVRSGAQATLDAARQEAAVILEAATLVAASVAARPVARAPEPSGALRLPLRAAVAMMTLQLRAAERYAEDAERHEHDQREQAEHSAAAGRTWQQRRDELDAELAVVQGEADEVLAGARGEAAQIASAALHAFVAQRSAELARESVAKSAAEAAEEPAPQEVAETIAEPASEVAVGSAPEPVTEMSAEPAYVEPAEPALDVAAEPVFQPVAEPMQQMPFRLVAQPAQQLPVNVVIDAEAFARVFATVLATAIEERQPVWAPTAQMFSTLPIAPPAPVKQSFWSHAKHVDVLLLSAAMVIVLVVLAAWLV